MKSTWITLPQSQLLQELPLLPEFRSHPLLPVLSDPKALQAPEAVACAGPHAKHQVSPLSPSALILYAYILTIALQRQRPQPFVCPICFDDTQTNFAALPCDHTFCSGCWTAYITSKIREEGEHSIRCMGEGCALMAHDKFVHAALAEDEQTLQRFNELLVRHFVASNPNLKFCPYPSCTHTVSCPAAASKSALTTTVPTVTCGADSSHKFCFGCPIESDHRPVICGVAKMWLRKCRDDSETANWIKSNTKECSQCQSTIEKNGGCKSVLLSWQHYQSAHLLSYFGSHMTCKKCKHEFCWVCMGMFYFLRRQMYSLTTNWIRTMVRTWYCLVFVQSLRREGWRGRSGCSVQESSLPRTLPTRKWTCFSRQTRLIW